MANRVVSGPVTEASANSLTEHLKKSACWHGSQVLNVANERSRTSSLESVPAQPGLPGLGRPPLQILHEV